LRITLFPGHLGAGLSAGYYAFGAPDGNGSSGRFVAPHVSYRLRVGWSAKDGDTPESSEWFVMSAGAGYAQLGGYERIDGDRFDFTHEGIVIPARVGVAFARGPLLLGMNLDAFVAPGQGYAILFGFDIGAAIGL
jgi:hypothetical protein